MVTEEDIIAALEDEKRHGALGYRDDGCLRVVYNPTQRRWFVDVWDDAGWLGWLQYAVVDEEQVARSMAHEHD